MVHKNCKNAFSEWILIKKWMEIKHNSILSLLPPARARTTSRSHVISNAFFSICASVLLKSVLASIILKLFAGADLATVTVEFIR